MVRSLTSHLYISFDVGCCFAQAFKQSVIGIAREYFLSADTEEVATALSELAKPEMHHIFVKQVRAQ